MKEKTTKRLRVTAIVLLSILVSYIIIATLPRFDSYKGDNVLLKHEYSLPRLIAHRGGAGEFPGNTLEAFYNAYSVDENAIMETDVSITKDGVLILCHNVFLDKTTNVTGPISEWSYADLCHNPDDNGNPVNFGYYNETEDGILIEGTPLKLYTDYNGKWVKPSDVPDYPNGLPNRDKEVYLVTTFEELLLAFPNNIINVEFKQDGELGVKAFKEMVKIVERNDAFDRVVFTSFHNDLFKEFQKSISKGEVPANFMCSPGVLSVATFYVLQLLNIDLFYSSKIAVLQIPMEKFGFDLSTLKLVKSAHKHNIAVQYWTIDKEDDMRELIKIGADGIMTDRPHKLMEVYSSYYRPYPI